MGRLHWWVVALGAAACGNVAVGADAPRSDAEIDTLTCMTTQLVCANTCVDPMTDSMHCGDCDVKCQTVGESCVAGHCTDMITSCSQLHMLTPSAADGFYTLIDSSRVYCDMTDGAVTYEALSFGQFNIVTAGYDLVTPTDLGHASIQAAFVALYNAQGGATTIAPVTIGNCCFKFDAGANELFFGGNFLTPITTAGVAACAGLHSDPAYRFDTVVPTTQVHTPQNPPLAANFFTANPATGAVDQCSDNNNPAFFFKRHQ
jgi:hypothetical protein